MAKFAEVQVTGARELRKKLADVEDGLDDLKRVHKTIADRAAEKARARVPRRTGRLASSVRGAGTKTAATVRFGKKTVPYTAVIEFGGYPEGTPFVKDGKHVYPAVRDFAPEARDLFKQEVKRITARF